VGIPAAVRFVFCLISFCRCAFVSNVLTSVACSVLARAVGYGDVSHQGPPDNLNVDRSLSKLRFGH
jgi:hypothetical protein